jgi:hypothetical protein
MWSLLWHEVCGDATYVVRLAQGVHEGDVIRATVVAQGVRGRPHDAGIGPAHTLADFRVEVWVLVQSLDGVCTVECKQTNILLHPEGKNVATGRVVRREGCGKLVVR